MGIRLLYVPVSLTHRLVLMKAPRWTLRPDVLDYVVEAYAGTEGTGTGRRRVFIWEDGTEIKMGNTEAFALHLLAKFELTTTVSLGAATSALHELLRQLGEQVKASHTTRVKRGKVGTFTQPEPEEWKIGDVDEE